MVGTQLGPKLLDIFGLNMFYAIFYVYQACLIKAEQILSNFS